MTDFCNNEEWLAAYLDRRLTDEERRSYEKHVAKCPRCLAALLNAKQELDEMAGVLSRDPPRKSYARGLTPPVYGGPRTRLAPRRTPPPAAAGARGHHRAVSYLALGIAAAMAILLGSIFLSPAWDPALRSARAEITSILSTTQLGELQLAGERYDPAEPPAAIRGEPARHHRQLDRLENTLTELGRRYPGNPRIQLLLGHLHLAANRFDRAEVAYRRAAHLAPNEGSALNNLAVVSYRRGSIDAAFDHLAEAVERDDVPAEVYYNIGILHRAAGDTTEANRYLELYIRMRPSSPWAHKARSLIKG
jgi:tetratricopeptide (TPR) repeat protein